MQLIDNKKNRASVSELRQPTKFGVCLSWPDESLGWVHPEDKEIAERLVPGNRIFKRQACRHYADRELGYSLISYAAEQFRVLPAIWLPIKFEGIEIGDLVEIKSRLGRRRPAIGKIRDIHWNRLAQRIEYFVDANTIQSNTPLKSDDLQPAMRLNEFLNERELSLSAKTRFA
jgi:hypothetical protein